MSEAATLAKPYAKAAYEFAFEASAVASWHSMLQDLESMVADKQIAQAIASPDVTSEQCANVLLAVAGDRFDKYGQNFVKCLAQNNRLSIVKDILAAFETLKAIDEKTIGATVTTAIELSDKEKDVLQDLIQKSSACEVTLDFQSDEALIAGAVITIGDRVIDGSVRTQLGRMADMFN